MKQHGNRYEETKQPVTISLVQETLSKPDSIVIDSDKHIVLDLEGKTLTTTSSEYVLKNYGDLEIIDSSDEKTGKITSTTNHTIYNGTENIENTEDTDKPKLVDIKLENVKKFNDDDQYSFTYDKDKKLLVNTNNTKTQSLNTTAKGYLELDLTDYAGKYELSVSADISNAWSGYNVYGRGYVYISNEPDSGMQNGNIINIYEFHDYATSTTYKMDLAGGQKYCLNFKYEKSDWCNENTRDEFRITNVTLAKKQEGNLTISGGTIMTERQGWAGRWSAPNTYFSAIINAGYLEIKGGTITSNTEFTTGVNTQSGGTTCLEEHGNVNMSKSSTRAINVEKIGGLAIINGGNINASECLYTQAYMANAIVKGGNFSETCSVQITNYGKTTMDNVTLNGANSTNVSSSGAGAQLLMNDCTINSKSTAVRSTSSADINGCTLNGRTAISASNNINIKDCNMTTNYEAIYISGDCNMDIVGTNVTVADCNYYDYIIRVGSGITNLKIENSTLTNETSTGGCQGIVISDDSRGANINIKGTTSIKSQGSCICLGVSSTNTINIESGTLESIKTEAIWANANATGTINIGTKDRSVNNEGLSLKSKTWTIVGYRMRLNMYDGKLIGPADKIIAVPINELEVDKDLISSQYQEGEETTGFEVYELGTAEEEVAILKNAQEGESEEPYPTLKKAVQALKEQVGDEEPQNEQIIIKLLKNINQTEQIRIEKDQNIKIDLNGHKLYAMTENTIYNEGTLEIIDSKDDSEYENNLIGSTGATIIQNAKVNNEDEADETNETVTGAKLTIGARVKINYTASGVNNNLYKQSIKNEGVLNINDAEITTTGNYVYAVNNTGKMNLSGGKIKVNGQYSYGIYNTGDMEGNNLNMEMTGNYECGVYNNNSGKMKITSGQITSTGSSTNLIYHNSTGDAEIKGVTINNGSSTGIYNNNAGTVKINGNTEMTGKGTNIYNYNKGIIDINEATITSTNSNCIYNSSSGIINVFNATIQTTHNYKWSCGINNYSNGTVNIYDGKITAFSYALFNDNNGTMNIKKGTITSTNDIAIQNDAGTVVVGEKIEEDNLEKEQPDENNPTITGKTYGINNGGTFRFFDGSITGASNKSISGNVTERETGYQVIKTENADGTETATLKKVFIAEIKENNNENSTVKYSTAKELQAGIDELLEEKEYTIKVTSNFSMDNTEVIKIPSNRNVTLDINGYTVTSVNESTVINEGNLTIVDNVEDSQGSLANGSGGSNNACKQVISNQDGAILNIGSGKISKGGNYGYGVYNHSTGTVNMKGGTIVTSGQYGHGIYNEGTLEVNQGEITTNGQNTNGIYNVGVMKTKGGNIITNGSYSYGIYNKSTQNSKIANAQITAKGSYNYGIYNDKEGTLTIEEGTNIIAQSYGIYNNETAQITINAGTINANSYAVYNNRGTANITNGILTSSSECIYNSGGTVNITDGTITSNNNYGVYNRDSGVAKITGGTIQSNKTHGIYNESGTITLGEKNQNEEMQGGTSTVSPKEPDTNSPIIQGKTYGIYNDSTFNFYDGKIIGAIGTSINPNIVDKEEEYQIVKSEDNQLEIATLQKKDIIKIEEQTFQTIAEAQTAIDALDDSEHTINLLSDVYMCGKDNISISESKNIVLKLNGYSIISSSTTTITNNGTLKITDESDAETGKILGPAITQIENDGDLIINGGTYNTTHYFGTAKKLINNKQKLTWEKGNMELNTGNNYGIYNTGNATIEWKNGNIKTNASRGNQHVIYTDSTGDINWRNGEMSLYSRARGNYQYGIYNNNGSGKINIENMVFSEDGDYLVSNGTRQYYIYSRNTNEEKNVIKIGNVVGTIVGGNGYERMEGIDAENAHIIFTGGDFSGFDDDMTLSKSEVDIEGGTFKDPIQCGNNSKLTIDNGNIAYLSNSAETIINNGTINYIYSSGGESNIVMNAGTITNKDVTNSNNNTVEIYYGSFTLLGGTIESVKGYGVRISSSGEFTIGNNDDYIVHTETPSVKGATYGVYKEGGTFNFYDGVIEGTTKAFYGDVTNQPENYKVQYEDDTRTKAYLENIAEVQNKISVGDVHFQDMASAIKYAATTTNPKIVLHDDVKEEAQFTIPENQSMTINLNAHSLTADLEEAFIINEGDLTIIDALEEGSEDLGGSVASGAKIENAQGYAIVNNNTLTIGEQDGDVNGETPRIIGSPNAIDNKGTLKLYDGKLNDKSITKEQELVQKNYALARTIRAGAENVIQQLENVVQSFVQSPKITVDKEFPIWTNEDINATIYTTGRIMIDIVNMSENVELRSITVKKLWEMPDDEADNYRATIQLMKIVDGKKVEAKDKQGNKYIVKIVGNNTQTIENIPVYQGSNKIEYALEEIAVERKSDDSEDGWEEVPMTEFNVTYQKNKNEQEE